MCAYGNINMSSDNTISIFHTALQGIDPSGIVRTTANLGQHVVESSSNGSNDNMESDDDDVIDRLMKEMQTQTPSIYISVKNLIAYLAGN